MGIGKKIVGSKSVSRDKFIVDLCKNKKVLHVGCTDYPFFKKAYEQGYFLHEKVSKAAQKIVGIDIAQADITEMREYGYDARVIDAQEMSNSFQEESFEIVLLADVIEHIENPGKVIRESIKVLEKEGIIIVTVPNTFGIIRFLKSFFRYEQVHPDHLAYYSSGTLETLATRLGLTIKQLAWYQLEVRDKRPIVYVSAALERVITILFPWQAEGCIAVVSNENET